MRRIVYSLLLSVVEASSAAGQIDAGVIARCGASKGTAYYFEHPFSNPDGGAWTEDGISNGQLILVSLAGVWDTRFSDAVGATGYRSDGAQVILIGDQNGKLMLIAAHPNYVDTFTFDLFSREVLWSSHKIGTLAPKAAIYRAECE